MMFGRATAWLGALSIVALTAGSAAAEPKIAAAEYAEPTTRYAHGVLGDDEEWGALRMSVTDGARRYTAVIRLPDNRVFEDLAPRVLDLESDGRPEVVVVESDADQGARLAIYDAEGLRAATPFIGQRFRWLAPLGAADLDGDGVTELAYIDRPHLAKTLRVWRFDGVRLTPVANLEGLTNHRIGEAFISGGIRDCGDGPEIITADSGWQRVMATRLSNGALKTRALGSFDGQASFRAALACQ